jgi:uncharacterized OsmC-like protein
MAAAVNNGVNVGALLEAREALRKAPEAAKFTWRATCKWKKGTHSKTLIGDFFGLGQEQKHRTEFTFEADHPEIFASEDCGATPVELVLAGLASCLTAGVAAVAQNRGIQLRSVEAKLEGSMDKTSDEFIATITELKDALEHHIKDEEEEIFPQALEAVSEEEATDMGRQYAEMKKKAH